MTTIERTKFLEERKLGIGGSDIASVFNVGYGCRLRLWREKRGEVPDFPREETGPMELGNILEPYFAAKYERETGRTLEITDLTVMANSPEMRVHIDRTIMPVPRKGRGVLEIKSLGREMFFTAKRNGLCEDYILQLQYGMNVTGYDWGSFAIGNREMGDLIWWDEEPNPEIHALMNREVPRFWEQVKSGPPPAMLDPEDKRCQRCEYRLSCQGAALMSIPAQGMERDETLRPLVSEYWERRALKDEAEGLYDETRAEISARMGQRTRVAAGGSKIYFPPQSTMRKDVDRISVSYEVLRTGVLAMLAEAGESPDEFLREFPAAESMKLESISRPLRVFGK